MTITSLFFTKYLTDTLEDISSYQVPVLKSGTPQLSTTTPPGTVGNSSYFSGTVGEFYYVNSTNQFPKEIELATFECWFNVTDFAASRTLFAKGNSTNQNLLLKVNNSGYLQFITESGINITSIEPISTNTWYHVAVTVGSSLVKLWINGVLNNSIYGTLSNNTSGIFYIGTNATADSIYIDPFYGYIANTRIYSGILYSQSFTPTFYLPIIENVYSLGYEDLVFEEFDIGIYIADRQNKLEVCQKIANSIGGHLVTDINGNFRLVQVTDGIGKTSKYTISDKDIYDNSLKLKEKLDVFGAVKLAYCKNWTVQNSGLAAGLSADSSAVYSKDYFYTIGTDSNTLSQYSQSSEAVAEETLLIANSQAQTETTRRLNFSKAVKYIFSMDCYPHLLLVELGDCVTLNFPSRFNLSNKIGTVIGMNKDWFDGRVTLDVLIVV